MKFLGNAFLSNETSSFFVFLNLKSTLALTNEKVCLMNSPWKNLIMNVKTIIEIEIHAPRMTSC
jgi:hypothetical protein